MTFLVGFPPPEQALSSHEKQIWSTRSTQLLQLSEQWEEPSTTACHLAMPSKCLPSTEPTHTGPKEEALQAVSLQPWSEGQFPHLTHPPGRGDDTDSQAEVSPNKFLYKSCIDAFYTLRVRRIFKSCEPSISHFL